MSVCHNSILDKSKYIEAYINTKVDIDRTVPFGFTSSVSETGETKVYTHGKRNIEENLPFDENTIYRMASQSKFMGTVGFLKLIDKNLLDFDTPLSKYLPEYSQERMRVIQSFVPNDEYNKVSYNPIYTTQNSKIIYIRNPDHPFTVGDYVSLEWKNGPLNNAQSDLPMINGIPGFEIFNVHQITKVDQKGYYISLHTSANLNGFTGGYVKIVKVPAGVSRSICFSPDKMVINPKIETYYYTTQSLKRELTVLDVLTHGLGWIYYSSSLLYMCFGYSSDLIKSKIQSGIWNELGLPVGIPLSSYKCGIREWVRLASNIPLLYQPGEDWSYGPQLSILGALIEEITQQKVCQYLRNELWKPLNMNDTGFFLNSDKEHKSDLTQLNHANLYVNMPKMVLKFMGNDILEKFPPVYEAQKCLTEGPKSLCLIDCGMYTTVNDYMKFMKMFFDKTYPILSETMIKKVSTYQTCYDVTNLASVSSYSSGLGSSSNASVIRRERLLSSIKWGLGVGVMKGCKGANNNGTKGADAHDGTDENETELAITWGGVLGTRFLIDFCSGVAYNVGTNVIGPPAGTFDSDLIELNYKSMSKDACDGMLADLLI